MATVDHDESRRWVEARGGCPAHVKATGRKRNDPGILRIDYLTYSGQDTLEEMDWEDWFLAFDRHHLASPLPAAGAEPFSNSSTATPSRGDSRVLALNGARRRAHLHGSPRRVPHAGEVPRQPRGQRALRVEHRVVPRNHVRPPSSVHGANGSSTSSRARDIRAHGRRAECPRREVRARQKRTPDPWKINASLRSLWRGP